MAVTINVPAEAATFSDQTPFRETTMTHGAIVLCGGQSTRMGHDKANLPFGSETMLQRVVRRLAELIEPSRMVVVAAATQTLPTLPAEVIVARDRVAGRGPLEGFAVGLDAMPADVEQVFITSCDAPLLVAAFVQKLFELGRSADIAVPFDGHFQHPLSAVYRTTIQPHVNELLEANQLRVNRLFDLVKTLRVPLDELLVADPQLLSLVNINSSENYHQALRMAGIDI